MHYTFVCPAFVWLMLILRRSYFGTCLFERGSKHKPGSWGYIVIELIFVSRVDASAVTNVIASLPLPPYSALVVGHLKNGTIQSVWNTMIAEAANYYYGKCPNIGDSQHYRLIGMRMHATYPSICLQGQQNPWVNRATFIALVLICSICALDLVNYTCISS